MFKGGLAVGIGVWALRSLDKVPEPFQSIAGWISLIVFAAGAASVAFGLVRSPNKK